MGFGFGGFLLVVGLVLALAVEKTVSGVDLQLVGWIMAAVGLVVIALTAFTLNAAVAPAPRRPPCTPTARRPSRSAAPTSADHLAESAELATTRRAPLLPTRVASSADSASGRGARRPGPGRASGPRSTGSRLGAYCPGLRSAAAAGLRAAPRGSASSSACSSSLREARAVTRFSSSRMRRTPSMPMPDEVSSEISRSSSMSRPE